MTVFVLFLVSALAAVAAWRFGRRGVALGVGGFALLPAWTLARSLPGPVWWLLAAAAVVAVWHRWARSAGVVTRFAARTRRRAGVASAVEIWRQASGHAVKRRAGIIRPSLAGLSRRAAVAAAGDRGRDGVVPGRADAGMGRASKTSWSWSAGRGRGRRRGWPGGSSTTPAPRWSPRPAPTCSPCAARARGKRGPVLVFNPVGLGGIASTVRFDPLTGCTDPVTAVERATDLLAASSRQGSGDGEFWDGQARRMLAALLHAAALGRRSMPDVLGWVARPTERAARDVPGLLTALAGGGVRDGRRPVHHHQRPHPLLHHLDDHARAGVAQPSRRRSRRRPGAGVRCRRLLGARATVFLLGGQEAHAAPLVTALTGHIAREARRLAATAPGGRLDPPLGMFLDEAFLICPGAVGVLDRGHGRAGGDDLRRVPRPLAGAVAAGGTTTRRRS